MSSNFNFYVNRQGVQGKRGAKGEQGFSPVISVESQTANEYILRVENEDGSFLSPNLRGNAVENNGGTYIRFNPETEQMYTGFADSATTEQAGVVRMGTYEDLVAGESEELVPNVADVHDFVQNSIGDISGFVTTEQFNTYTSNTAITLDNLSNNKLDSSTFDSYTSTTDGILESLSTNKLDSSTFDSFANSTSSALNTLDTNKLDFTDLANSLMAGSNVSLSVDSTNKVITISSSGGGGGGTQVQSNWAETDNTDPSFIQNKPTLGTMAAEDASDYTPTTGLSDVAISGSYNDLLNKPQLFSGDYDDLINKPTIPAAANDATITITQGGVTKGSFTTNQSTNATIDIDAGGGSSLLSGNGIDINANDEIDIMQEDETEPDGYNWDFDTVGTLTENDGVYSGFSSANYLVSKSSVGQTFATSLEISMSFATGGSLPSRSYYQYLCNFHPNNYGAPNIVINNSRIYFAFSTNGSNSEAIGATDITIATNTNYTISIIYENGTITGTLTNNDTSDVIALSSSSPDKIHFGSTANIYLGVPASWNGNYTQAFNGSINTKNSYIKIDGVLVSDITENYTVTKPCAKATSSLYGLVKPDGNTTQVTNGVISTVNTVQSTTVNNIVQITQTDYDALTTKDANTMYIITAS